MACRRCRARLLTEIEQILRICVMCSDDDQEKLACDRLQGFLRQRRRAHTLPDGRTVGRL